MGSIEFSSNSPSPETFEKTNLEDLSFLITNTSKYLGEVTYPEIFAYG